MKLRPHHLLCTQGYSGKGYSKEFVANMDELVNRLRNEENVEVEIVFNTDDICAACPNCLGENLCTTNDKVNSYDSKLVNYTGLEEKKYIYKEIIREINSKLTEEKMRDICEGCCWYPISACRKNILNI